MQAVVVSSGVLPQEGNDITNPQLVMAIAIPLKLILTRIFLNNARSNSVWRGIVFKSRKLLFHFHMPEAVFRTQTV